MDDVVLVTQALVNGPEAFGAIIRCYKDIVFGVALARVRNFHDAEDIAQAVFIYAFEHLDTLKDPARLGAWLRTMTIHRCINHKQRRPPVVQVEDVDELQGAHFSPHTQLEEKELRDQVMAAIGRLKKVQRETVTLFYIGQYSQQEVAKLLEVPVGTVKSRLYEAKRCLKEEMMDMVSDTLKENAPNEAFDEQIFKMLFRYPARHPSPKWSVFSTTLKDLNTHGKLSLGGIQRALASPHWPTRVYAVKMLRNMDSLSAEDLTPLLKQAVKDSNRHVRRHAASGLLERARQSEQKRKDLMPIVTPLLLDPSNYLRRFIARRLWPAHWASNVPVEVASDALLHAPNPRTREYMETLLKRVLACRKIEAS